MKARDQTNLGPHTGIIKFNIYVHKILSDGTIDPVIVDCSDLFRDFEISRFSHLDLLKRDFKNAESLEIKNKSRDFKISRIYFIIEIQNLETANTIPRQT